MVEQAHALEQAASNEQAGSVAITLARMLAEINKAATYLQQLSPEDWEVLHEKQPELLETAANEIRAELRSRRVEEGGKVATSPPQE